MSINHQEGNAAVRLCEYIKLALAPCIVFALVAVIIAGISLGYSVLPAPVAVNFILLFFCLVLLAYVEALHYGVVAIEKWNMEEYEQRFPRAFACWKLVDTPQKVKKFLVGRQFFVIFVVFLIAQITVFPTIPSDFLGLPPVLVLVLLQTGLPGIALVLTFGQLISQIYVEEYTLEFLNLLGNNFVIRLCLAAEFVGVCHFSWLIYYGAAMLCCSSVRQVQSQIDNGEMTGDEEMTVESSSPTEKIRGRDFDVGMKKPDEFTWFDHVRFVWSTCATLGSVGVIMYGISLQVYVLPSPPIVAYLIAFSMLTCLFYLEGMMIAVVATQYWDREQWKEVYPRAYELHEFVTRPDNVKRFIIGRQFFTVLTNFLLAQVFTFESWECPESFNPILFFVIIKSGLVGVLTILAFGQLLPELLAAQYPLRFMNMRGSCTIVYISQVFDAMGVGHTGWSIYYLTRGLCCTHSELREHNPELASKPKILHVHSAEILAETANSSPNSSAKRLVAPRT